MEPCLATGVNVPFHQASCQANRASCKDRASLARAVNGTADNAACDGIEVGAAGNGACQAAAHNISGDGAAIDVNMRVSPNGGIGICEDAAHDLMVEGAGVDRNVHIPWISVA